MKKIIKKNNLYLQVAEIIINDIVKKKYVPRDKLPSEKELSEIFSVSRFTIREALSYLEKNNYIIKKHGVGTFIREDVLNQKLYKFYSFSNEMRKLGKSPSTEIINFRKERLNESNILNALNLEKGSIIIILERLRLADNEIIMYETSYLPNKFFFDLEESTFKNRSMYQVFQEDYGIVFSGAKEKFTAIIPNKNIREKLTLDKLKACMKIERCTFMNEKVIEYTISYADSEKMTFEVELNANNNF